MRKRFNICIELSAADPDLKSMHGDARFKALIAKAHEQAKASAQ
jgi:hypothetical protein